MTPQRTAKSGLRDFYVPVENPEALDDILSGLTGVLDMCEARHHAIRSPCGLEHASRAEDAFDQLPILFEVILMARDLRPLSSWLIQPRRLRGRPLPCRKYRASSWSLQKPAAVPVGLTDFLLSAIRNVASKSLSSFFFFGTGLDALSLAPRRGGLSQRAPVFRGLARCASDPEMMVMMMASAMRNVVRSGRCRRCVGRDVMAQKRRGLLQDVLLPSASRVGTVACLGWSKRTNAFEPHQQHDQGEGAKTENSPDREKDAHER